MRKSQSPYKTSLTLKSDTRLRPYTNTVFSPLSSLIQVAGKKKSKKKKKKIKKQKRKSQTNRLKKQKRYNTKKKQKKIIYNY